MITLTVLDSEIGSSSSGSLNEGVSNGIEFTFSIEHNSASADIGTKYIPHPLPCQSCNNLLSEKRPYKQITIKGHSYTSFPKEEMSLIHTPTYKPTDTNIRTSCSSVVYFWKCFEVA